MRNSRISEILLKYETDKVKDHHYGEAYDDLLSKYDKEAKLNILEIGIQKGGSLCAWREAFPNAKITGIDIVDVVKPEYKREDIEYIISDIKEWRTEETFDIIIDDGSHFEEDVSFVIDNFKSRLRMGGIMIVEDIQNEFIWKGHEIIKTGSNYDDRLLVIRNYGI